MLANLTVSYRAGVWGKVAPHAGEVALVVGAYFTYMFIRRVIIPGAAQIGLDSAGDIIAFERALGLLWEPTLQGLAAGAGDAVLILFNYLCIFTFFPVVLTTAVILYVMNRDCYRHYRRMVMLSFGVALLFFAVFPLAPPRFMDIGVVDTIVQHGPPWYGSREAMAYYNAYAAMPSLHFAWTVLFGFLYWNSGPRLLKPIGVLYPLTNFFAIIITGNHYILDAIGGGFMMLLVYVVYQQVILPRWFQPAKA